MKKGVRIVALLIAMLMLLGVFASVLSMTKAAGWEDGVYAYGAGLSEKDIENTAKLLKIEDVDKVNKTRVTAEDLYKYVLESGKDSSMISSVYVKKGAEGSGVKVVITTPANITQISEKQYENAAITAGISDAVIYVGAVTPVTGSSALTGVYKAFELNGEKLDQEATVTANKEIDTVNAIVQEHKGDEKFSTDKIADVVVYVKEALINFNEKNDGKGASKDEIKQMIDEALAKYDLKGVLTQINIDKLVVFFQQFQNSPAINSEKVKEQLSILGKQLKDLSGKYIDQAKDFVNSEQGRSFFQSLIDFLTSLFNKIAEMFK